MSGDEVSKQVVLLVDDDLRTVRRMADMLREDGLVVETARDGAAAIARLARSPVAALVTELTLAHADGVAVARYARSQRPGIPVLLVTGHPHLFDPAALAAGPPAVLFTKPVSYADLKDALLAALAASIAAPVAVSAYLDAPRLAAALDSPANADGDTVPGAEALRAFPR